YYSYGVQIYEDAGAVANFEAEQTNISVKGGDFANAVFANGGSVNIKGNANLSAQNTTGRARVIALESNPSPVHDSYVSLSGDNISLTGSTAGDWDAWGIYASGFTCTVDINSQNLTIDVSSERIAHGLTSQFSGTVHLYSGTITTINATSENGRAIGIEASWWDGSAGKIISEGELNVTAKATTAIAVGSSNTGSFTANKINAKALGENAKAVDVSNGASLTIKQLNAEAQGTTWATALNINSADSVVIGSDGANTVLSAAADYGVEGIWLSGGEADLKGDVSISADANDFAWGISLDDGVLTTDNLTVSTTGDYANALYLSGASTLNLNGETVVAATGNSEGYGVSVDVDSVLNVIGSLEAKASGSDSADIYNDGTINVKGDLILDSGITGDGKVEFAKTASVTATVDKTTIAADSVKANGAKLNLIIANGTEEGTYDFVKANDFDDKFDIAENSLYNILKGKSEAPDASLGQIVLEKKSSEEIADEMGVNQNVAEAINAVTAGDSKSNKLFNEISDELTTMLQSGDPAQIKAAINSVEAMSAEETPVVYRTQIETVHQVFGAISTRLSSGSVTAGNEGIASGDSEIGSVWAKVLHNRARMDDDTTHNVKGFEAKSNGIALGFERFVSKDVKLGFGYGYTKSDIDPDSRDIDAWTHTAFAYGEYKPSNWFVNGAFSWNWSHYDEKKRVLGRMVKGDYGVDTIAAQMMTGYDFNIESLALTPEVGARYVHFTQESHDDGLGTHFSGDKSDTFTGVIGGRIGKRFTLNNGIALKPEVRGALTYDFVNDNANYTVTMANGASYIVDGRGMKRMGGEFGVGLTAEFCDAMDVTASYEGRIRQNYYDNTGMLSIKYNF
ncbi:MAG: autotransporter outer membrane beta-barrel domain-containing protein, partial [Alphaproteobacteria bacterium]